MNRPLSFLYLSFFYHGFSGSLKKMGLVFTEIQIYFPNVTAASTIWRTQDKNPQSSAKYI